MKAKTKTIGYLTSKLDRNFEPKPTFEQVVKAMCQLAMRDLRKIYKKANNFASYIVAKNPMVMQQQAKLREERESLYLSHIIKMMRRKREKVMYSQWGHEPEPTTQQVINDLRFGKW